MIVSSHELSNYIPTVTIFRIGCIRHFYLKVSIPVRVFSSPAGIKTYFTPFRALDMNKVKNREGPLQRDGGSMLPHKDWQLPALRGRPREHHVPVWDDSSSRWLQIVRFQIPQGEKVGAWRERRGICQASPLLCSKYLGGGGRWMIIGTAIEVNFSLF